MKRFRFLLLFALLTLPAAAQYRSYQWQKQITVPYPDGDLTVAVFANVFHVGLPYAPKPIHVSLSGWAYTPDPSANVFRVTVRWRNGAGEQQAPRVEWITMQVWPMFDGGWTHGLDRISLRFPPDSFIDHVTVEKIRYEVRGAATVSADGSESQD